MAEVFINYRTGDGEMTAAMIDQELSRRFGSHSAFRASKSLQPGDVFTEELLRHVRRSSLLLTVIGTKWADFPQLHQDGDWVRKEILEALAYGIPVVPVLEGRSTERLRRDGLPAELAQLADLHSMRLDTHHAADDLKRIGDLVAEMIPALREHEGGTGHFAEGTSAPDSVRNTTEDAHGTVVQGRNVGDVGTVVKNGSGPVHTGSGSIYQNSRHVSGDRHFTGDGMTYFEGDNHGGVNQHFGKRDRSGNDER